MKSLRKKISRLPVIKFLSSIKITVICLSLLFILTFWGTIAQVEGGLYASQERYFHSLFFLVFGFLPFPGAQLVLWVLFINLTCVAITRFVYDWKHAGILIIHCGLLTYFVAAFVTFVCVEESNVRLMEQAGTSVSQSYNEWEISMWKDQGASREVTAVDTKNLKDGAVFRYDNYGFNVRVDYYYRNSGAYIKTNPLNDPGFINASGIQLLKPKPDEIEPEKNIPGGRFQFQSADDQTIDVVLYGGEAVPTVLAYNGEMYFVQLRKKRFELPFLLKLVDFRMELHPNTDVARSYESLVEVESGDVSRKVLISMNNPLRHKDYTFYQASYSIDQVGREYSTLAVVKNSGRLLPYFSSLITFLGLVVHFLVMGLSSKGKKVKR